MLIIPYLLLGYFKKPSVDTTNYTNTQISIIINGVNLEALVLCILKKFLV
jgi:hypothetical protein